MIQLKACQVNTKALLMLYLFLWYLLCSMIYSAKSRATGLEFKSSAITDASKHVYVVFLIRVFPIPKPVCIGYFLFWYPKPSFFQPTINLGI